MPRPGTKLIHPDLLDTVRPTIELGMTGTCRITTPGVGGTIDPVTKVFTPNEGTDIYTGECWTQPQNRSAEQRTVFAEDVETTSRYTAAIPIGAPVPSIGDRFQVLTSSDDELAGRVLWIADVSFDDFGTRRPLSLVDRQPQGA